MKKVAIFFAMLLIIGLAAIFLQNNQQHVPKDHQVEIKLPAQEIPQPEPEMVSLPKQPAIKDAFNNVSEIDVSQSHFQVGALLPVTQEEDLKDEALYQKYHPNTDRKGIEYNAEERSEMGVVELLHRGYFRRADVLMDGHKNKFPDSELNDRYDYIKAKALREVGIFE